MGGFSKTLQSIRSIQVKPSTGIKTQEVNASLDLPNKLARAVSFRWRLGTSRLALDLVRGSRGWTFSLYLRMTP